MPRDGAQMGWFDRPEFGANVGLIDEIYRQYLDDPGSVSPAWREFFADEGEPEPEPKPAPKPAPKRAPLAEAPEDATQLRGTAARIVEAMQTSLAVPTATSVRT